MNWFIWGFILGFLSFGFIVRLKDPQLNDNDEQIEKQVIIGGRGMGKTTMMLKIASMQNLQIVCANIKHCKVISKMAESLNLSIKPPIPISRLKERSYGCKFDCAIDDLDICLYHLFPSTNIKYATITKQNKIFDIERWVGKDDK